MDANPPLGVVLHAIGGLASAVFYLPYRKVKHWVWESYWLTGGVFSWIVAPWVIVFLAVPDLLIVLRNATAKSLFWSYFFGALWGVGGLTFGLTVRYLGFALGTAMALGYCAAFGTLLPPIVSGEFARVVKTTSGIIVMAGVAVCLFGIIISGLAGISKEREMPEKEKRAAIREFSFAKGVWVATFCGIVGVYLSEWNGVSRLTHRLMIFGLVVLVASTVVIGYGNYLNKASAASDDPRQLHGIQEQASRAVLENPAE